MEARNKAIANRSRAPSPAPHANGRAAGGSHRRDRSSGATEATRFPIHPSSSPTNERKLAVRSSLDVPDATSPPINHTSQSNNAAVSSNSNATAIPERTQDFETSQPEPSETTNGTTGIPEKKDSLSRSSRFPARKHMNTNSLSRTAPARGPGDRSSLASMEGEKVGVQLVDRPMDD